MSSPDCCSRAAVRRLFAGLCLLLALSGARDALAFPQITVQPFSTNVFAGNTVTFSVTVTQVFTVSPMFVQWRRNGANIPGTHSQVLPGSGVSTFTITNAQPTNAGSYSAVAFDSDGAVNTTNVNLFLTNLTALAVGNLFTNRGSINGSSGTGVANNFSSTNELGTPRNNNIPSGGMVWLKWTASFYPEGVATVDTRGSDFDTTLGIYQISTNNNSAQSVTNLVAIIGSDDEGEYFNSAASFNVTSPSEYEIGIGGYYGSRGHIVLNWSVRGPGQIPVIVQQPQSQTVLSNASAFLSVTVATNTYYSSVLYQWYFNGTPINPTNSSFTGATNSSMTIANVLPSTVGQYRVHLQFSGLSTNFATFSQAAQIQINVEGNTRAAAQAKLHQAADPNSYPGGPVPLITPVSGFTGTQIYNTYQSEEEPGEPNHCGKVGGSPYWFSCQPTNTGTLTVDAYTPTYTNVLAIYTWPGGSNYNSLVQVPLPGGCATTNPGVGHQTASFTATNGTTYYLVVDGLNSGYGQVTLSLTFASPPLITTNPQSQTVSQGSNVTLTASAFGTPSPSFQWRTNAVNFSGRTNSTLTVTNFQVGSQGNYDVVVTNLIGAATSSVAALYLNSPLRFGSMTFSPTGGFAAILLGMANSNYVLQASTNLAATNWIPVLTNSSPFGVVPLADTNTQNYPKRFYRTVKP